MQPIRMLSNHRMGPLPPASPPLKDPAEMRTDAQSLLSLFLDRRRQEGEPEWVKGRLGQRKYPLS